MKRNKHKGRHFHGGATRLIMGKHCIEEVIKSSPERIVRAYTSKESSPLLADIQNHGIPIKLVSPHKLTDMVHSDSHQSIVVEVKEVDQHDFRHYVEGLALLDEAVILMLDSISDPHNLGAILRAAECFGVNCVIWSKNRGTDLTPTVSKVSVGASELVEIIRVSNLVETAKSLKEAGYFIITSEIDKRAIPIQEFSFPRKSVLVMGSEEKGVQRLLSQQADEKVYIPMGGSIDSLNVSQATAVFLSLVCKK